MLDFIGRRAKRPWHPSGMVAGLCVWVLVSSMLSVTAHAAAAKSATATAQPKALLGLNFGLAVANQQEQYVAAQALSTLLGDAVHRNIIWETGFNLGKSHAVNGTGTPPYRYAFIKPPNLTAALLAAGWHLVAVARDTIDFGTDLIAASCPGQPGKVLLGGDSLSILDMGTRPAQTCVTPDQVWQSSSAVMLAPKAGSLVDLVAQKIWREHGAPPRYIARVQTQNAVLGLMRDMHVAAVGVVTPVVAKAWAKQGGIVLAHRPMPFWALVAAPDVPTQEIADARRALMSPPAASVNQALHIPGWIDGDPKQYADFLKWLKG
ncbi:MAG: hypothetical protein AB1412_06065 [Pseudomonadota bacterium]